MSVSLLFFFQLAIFLCNVVHHSFINFLILFFPAGVRNIIFPYTRPEESIAHDYVWSLECVFFYI